MARRFQNLQKFKHPERFLVELLKKYVRGEFLEKTSNVTVLRRAVVLAVDVEGGKLENPSATGELQSRFPGGNNLQTSYQASVGPPNPQNSIKARILTDGLDQFVSDQGVRTFWPLFPEHLTIPIKPGEHVYVMFEDPDMQHGLWLGKVAGHEDLNFFRGQSSYIPDMSGSLSSMFGLSDDRSDPNTLDDKRAGDSRIASSPLSSLFFGEK